MTVPKASVKLSDLISALGVGIIGFGLGTLIPTYFQPFSPLIILIGTAMHGPAMYYKSKTETKRLLWVRLLYWLCWIIIAGLAVYVLATILLRS